MIILNVKFEQVLNKQIDFFGYMVNANSYELLYINENLKNALKLSDDSFIGKNCYEILNASNSPCSHCIKDTLTLNEDKRRHRYNENYSTCCVSNESITNIDGCDTFVSTSYDITNEINEIDTLKQSSTQNNTIINCAKTLLDIDNVNDAMDTLLQIICDYYDGELSLLYQRNYSTRKSRVEHLYCTPHTNQVKKEDINSYNFEEIPTWNQMLQSSNHIFLKSTDDNLHLYNYPDTFLEEEDSNLLIAPLKLKNRILGVIEVKDIKRNIDDFELLTTISAFIVNNMNIIQSKKELEETVSALFIRNSFNQVILDCVKTLMSDNDNTQAVARLLFTISNHFSAEGTYILQRDELNPDVFVENHVFCCDNSQIYNSLCKIPFEEMNVWYNNFEYKDLAFFGSVVDNLAPFSKDSDELQILIDNNITSFAITPIVKNEVITGFVFLCNPAQNTNDMSLLNIVTAFLINHIIKHELVKDLEFLSYTDKLTGLYNRNYYMNCIDKLRDAPNTQIGIIFADVNGLKRANDNFGHELGDTLIKWCANFFRKLGGEHVFRIGGDEFICFFEGISKDGFEEKVNSINENLYSYGDVHVSIGHIWSDCSSDIEDLIKESDKLMYEQKQKYYANKRNDRRATGEELRDFQRSIINLRSELS